VNIVLKKIILFVAIACLTLFLALPVQAEEGIDGGKIFNANCAACHALGSNRVVAAKNLKKETLEKYEMYSVEAISYQVTKGKNAMPAFAKKLNTDEIQAVAEYVLARADQGWKK
jgi:cytochrome c6